jgi:hypothetical protein
VRGYSANVTETCGEELNLIVDAQVEPATTADNTYLKGAVENSETVLGSMAEEISADGAYYSEQNEAYAKEQDKEIHYTGFPGKAGRYDYARSEEGVVVIDRVSGERQIAAEYKPGRYRFRANGKWRYITDKDIDMAECRRRTDKLPRELFNRRCHVEATIFQLPILPCKPSCRVCAPAEGFSEGTQGFVKSGNRNRVRCFCGRLLSHAPGLA